MTAGHELNVKEKMNLIEERRHDHFYYALDDDFHLSIPHKTDSIVPADIKDGVNFTLNRAT